MIGTQAQTDERWWRQANLVMLVLTLLALGVFMTG
jgi:hypothetical protein